MKPIYLDYNATTPIDPGGLAAMGVPADVARGSVRLSLGRFTSEGDVDRAGQLPVDIGLSTGTRGRC